MKRMLITAVAMILILVLPQSAEASIFSPERKPYGLPITVHVDGRYVASDVEPLMSENRVFLPMRAAAEEMGASVYWDNASRCVMITKDTTTAYFFVDNTTYYVNGQAFHNDVAPKIVGGRTMLPIRAFAESIGASVNWKQDILDVQISTGGPISTPSSIPAILPGNLHKAIDKYYVEPTKSGVGNWYCVYTMGRETIYELLFIAESSDGKRYCIEMFSKDLMGNSDADFLTIYKHAALKLGDHYVISTNGISDHIYESDNFLGFTYTVPTTDYFTYGNAYDKNGLYRYFRSASSLINIPANATFLSF